MSEYNKHKVNNDQVRRGSYVIHEATGIIYDGEWKGNPENGAVMDGKGGEMTFFCREAVDLSLSL
jgi:hypothetical protein